MTTQSTQSPMQPGNRKKIGLIDPEPKTATQTVEGLSPHQQALREATINNFKANKVRAYIAKQVEYINPNRQIGDAIRFLFDEHGHPPENAPLEDIIEERKKIENQTRWLEALCSELRSNLAKVKEIEELAFESLEL